MGGGGRRERSYVAPRVRYMKNKSKLIVVGFSQKRKGGSNFEEGTCPRDFGRTNEEATGGDLSWEWKFLDSRERVTS